MNEYHFKPEVAQEYGVSEAIFIHSLSYWIEKNKSNRRHFHDGRYWSYDSHKAIAERFPFWTVRQIERIIANCKEKGAILVGNYNTDKTVRTQWYALTDATYSIYFTETVDCIPPNSEMAEPQAFDDKEKKDGPIPPNGEMQTTKEGDPFHQTVKCNKGNTYLPSKDIPPKSPKGEGGKKKPSLPDEVRDMLNAYVENDKELAEEMVAFMEVRQSLKAVNSERAVKALLKELDELSGGQREMKLALVRQSVLNSWKSVFPIRGGEMLRQPPGQSDDSPRSWGWE